jgi:ubiquinone/menaquinone biosynthesis C-methylase UbiE
VTAGSSDLTAYREHPREQERLRDLMRLIPDQPGGVLDVGARDGFISHRLVERFEHVTALDLEKPSFDHPRITAVKGDVTDLKFGAKAFAVVLCAEVLEHIPPNLLQTACKELSRVSSAVVVIGVPYQQDLRLGRTRCVACKRTSPPWGHVNSFDESRLTELFAEMEVDEISYVGESNERTTNVAAWLMDRAGNPYGTYEQEEPCVHCGARVTAPTMLSLPQRILAKLALWIDRAVLSSASPKARWIHVRFVKRPRTDAEIKL